MGLFWADSEERPVEPQPSNQKRYDWLWANPVQRTYDPQYPKVGDSGASRCPVKHSSSESKCPVDHNKFLKKKETINPMNNMPELSSAKIAGQKVDLPTERTISSIPKGREDAGGNWEYPSPQQMLNAMVRKSGPDGIDEEAVESMVDVHNFLNEGVWDEVLDWESKYTKESHKTPRLAKFTGRPNDMSPQATLIQWLGWLFPKTYGCPPPFDRHDWTVLRATKDGKWEEVRYVIDFYEAPDEGDAPAFSIVVRPAADSLQSVADRITHAAKPVWDKAMGHSS